MFHKHLKNIFFFLVSFSVVLSGLDIWLTRSFGKVHILQVVWHIRHAHTLQGFDTVFLVDSLKLLALCLVVIAVLFMLFYRRRAICLFLACLFRQNIVYVPSKSTDFFLFFCVLVFAAHILGQFYHKFSVRDLFAYQSQEYSAEKDFILHNYKVPALEEITFSQKNNLVIVMLEAMEQDLRIKKEHKSSVPYLESLLTEKNTFPEMTNCYGSKWTIAALTAWHFGLPLHLPKYVGRNKYKASTFLPNALNVFEVLNKNGYQCTLFMGSDKKFANTQALFARGNFTIYDKNFYEEKFGQKSFLQKSLSGRASLKKSENVPETTTWGYHDSFVLGQAVQEYRRLSEQNGSFVLFVQTIDTHPPYGFPENVPMHGDMRDSWEQMDNNIKKFLAELQKNTDENTVILLLADHYLFTCKNEDSAHAHELYNVFLGENVPEITAEKRLQNVNSMDIAPTILQLAGAKWGHDQFGLGISLFSEEKSLSEIHGRQELDKLLMPHSEYYEKFF